MTARNGTGTKIKKPNMTDRNGTGTTIKKQTGLLGMVQALQ